MKPVIATNGCLSPRLNIGPCTHIFVFLLHPTQFGIAILFRNLKNNCLLKNCPSLKFTLYLFVSFVTNQDSLQKLSSLCLDMKWCTQRGQEELFRTFLWVHTTQYCQSLHCMIMISSGTLLLLLVFLYHIDFFPRSLWYMNKKVTKITSLYVVTCFIMSNGNGQICSSVWIAILSSSPLSRLSFSRS